MEQVLVLSILGVVCTIFGFCAINARDDQINTATWFMWVIGDGLEVGSYLAMTDQDLFKNSIPIAFAVGSGVTFIIALMRRRFSAPDAKDVSVVSVDLAISLGWWQHYVNAAIANIMFVSTEIVSFIPLYRGILNGREREYPLTWIWWTAADGFFLTIVLSLPHATEELVYPIVAMIAHLFVVVCILIRRKLEKALL